MTTSASFHQKLASPDYVTVPIVGYEVMEERERFTVSPDQKITNKTYSIA